MSKSSAPAKVSSKLPIGNRLRKILLHLLLLYATIALLAFSMQRDLIYRTEGSYQTPATLGLAKVEELRVAHGDSSETLIWLKLAPKDRPTVVYLHGNGGTLTMFPEYFTYAADEKLGLMLVEYRGYPGVKGSPSEAVLYADARAAIQHLIQTRKIPEKDLILLGHSLGTGVAVQMATEFKVKLLTLVSPFTSLAEPAALTYPFLPVRWLLRDHYDSLSKMPNVTSPVLIFHGTHDGFIPIELGERLFEAANEPKRFVALRGVGHNDMNMEKIFHEIGLFN